MMKKLFSPILCLGIAIGLWSCDNELDINADYKEIAVVYGLLDPKLDTQFVRIERGWLGTSPASASYDIPDSLYYGNLTAELIELNENGSERTRTTLLRDDSSRSRKDNGPFTTNSYRIYRTDGQFQIDPTRRYRLEIRREGIEEVVSAETDIIITTTDGLPTTSGGRANLIDFTQPRQTPNLAEPPIFGGRFQWEDNTGYSAQLSYSFHYKELDLTTRQITRKSIEVELGEVDENDETYNFNSVYQDITARVKQDPNVVRFFQKLTTHLVVIDRTFYTYIDVNLPTTGIIQARPEFTNVENGIGIFASRTSTRQDSVRIETSQITQLVLSDLLCELRFATATSGDTLICDFRPGTDNVLVPYR